MLADLQVVLEVTPLAVPPSLPALTDRRIELELREGYDPLTYPAELEALARDYDLADCPINAARLRAKAAHYRALAAF